MRVRYRVLLIAAVCSQALHAFSGIAVHDVKEDGAIRAIRIENSAIADSFVIGNGSFPVINTHGTHVAFWATRNGRPCLAVVRSDVPLGAGNHRIKYLVECEQGGMETDWPRGDWVWFGARDNRELWRVNVQTGEVHQVTKLRAGGRCFRLSTDARRINGMKSGARYLYTLPEADDVIDTIEMDMDRDFSNGGGRIGGGCGASISPSGNHMESQSGSGHENVAVYEVDYDLQTINPVKGFKILNWNEWSVDDFFQYCVSYNNDPCYRVEKVGGGGYTEHFWCRNSEYWLCNIVGWSPGGRFGENGSNVALINWKDEISMNVSRFPHKNA
ncbi:MAG: hypothetical protein GF350_06865, partial [Chitinivibrionales bacterium]|nr:hypothetical protein [Chitinivibrionales bacterium]